MGERQPASPCALDPPHEVDQVVHQRRARSLGQPLGRELADLGAEGACRLVAVQQHVLQQLQLGHGRRVPAAHGQRPPGLAVVRSAGQQMRDHRRDHQAIAARKHLGQQAALRIAGRKLRLRPDAVGAGWQVVIAKPCQKGVQPVLAQQHRDAVQACHPVQRHGLEDFGPQVRGRAVVEFGKPVRHPGFQRKAAQDGGAEAVDRLHLQPARRLDRLREQAPRGPQVGGARDPQMGKLGPQRLVGQHRPAAQTGQQAVLHLGRGGLGVGQAQDALGPGAAQQKPRHPVGQDAGLARARVGGKPGGPPRIGRRPLRAGGVVQRRICTIRPPGCGHPFIHDGPPSPARPRRPASIPRTARSRRSRRVRSPSSARRAR